MPERTRPDADLVRGALEGDEGAFAALVRRYQRAAYAACRACGVSAVEADDVETIAGFDRMLRQRALVQPCQRRLEFLDGRPLLEIEETQHAKHYGPRRQCVTV